MNILRRLVEIASRKVILKRKIPKKYGGGIMFVTPESSLQYWRYNLEKVDPGLLSMLKYLKPSDTVWDIGANNGLFSFLASGILEKSGNVLAIEADSFQVDLLYKTLSLHNKSKSPVQILQVAIADKIGIQEFEIANRGRASNRLNTPIEYTQTGGAREKRNIITVHLDWLLEKFSAPQFIKVDIEGAENLLVKGATKIISEVRPVIYMEVASNNAKEISNIFKKEKYTLYNPHKKPYTALEQCVTNTLIIPNEKINEYNM